MGPKARWADNLSKELANDCLALDADIHTIEFNRLLLDDMHYSQVLKHHHVCDSAPVNTTYFLAAIAALYVYTCPTFCSECHCDGFRAFQRLTNFTIATKFHNFDQTS